MPDPLPHARHRGIAAGVVPGRGEEASTSVDGALDAMSGMTSQPNLNALVEALRFSARDPGLDLERARRTARLLGRRAPASTRRSKRGQVPAPPKSTCTRCPAASTRTCIEQARCAGPRRPLARGRRTYAEVNRLFGDIVKVTPTSKVVGDMALFMMANNLTPSECSIRRARWPFPNRWSSSSRGSWASRRAAFPQELQRKVLRGEPLRRTGPATQLAARRFRRRRALNSNRTASAARRPAGRFVPALSEGVPRLRRAPSAHSETSACCPRPSFFYGMEGRGSRASRSNAGKTLIVQVPDRSAKPTGWQRTVYFELNGQPREVLGSADKSLQRGAVKAGPKRKWAMPSRSRRRCPVRCRRCRWRSASEVAAGQKRCGLEAMKMETHIAAERDCEIAAVHVQPGDRVASKDLLIELKAATD